MYNTGSQSRGFSNGYAGRVVGNAGVSDGIQPAAVRIGEPMPATDTSAGSSAAAQLAALVEENTSPAGSPKRSEEHTSELQSLMRISYAVFCLKKKKIEH